MSSTSCAASSSQLQLMLSLLFVSIIIPNVICVIGDENPLTAKAYALSYWEKHVTAGLPISNMLMEKASPLTSAQVAEYGKIADDPKVLSERLPEFCAQGNLMCFLNSADYRRIRSSGISLDEDLYDIRYRPPYDEKNNKWRQPPPGTFFREAMLKPRTLITMPELTDKLPVRSFLPRPLVSKIPFASQKLSEIKNIFHAGDDISSMFKEALDRCELEAMHGETKRCVASIEDMIDFATFVLGQNVVVRTLDNTVGSNSKVLLGNIKGINGGKLTNLVSCHQMVYPYLLYYCHSVTNTRVYEVDILDPKTKFKISHGIAICHEDTASFSPNHPAFVALGTSPGKTEICHWSRQNDFSWVTAD